MTWITQHWLALGLLAAYTAALLYNAYLGTKGRGMAGYYVGNREMSAVSSASLSSPPSPRPIPTLDTPEKPMSMAWRGSRWPSCWSCSVGCRGAGLVARCDGLPLSGRADHSRFFRQPIHQRASARSAIPCYKPQHCHCLRQPPLLAGHIQRRGHLFQMFLDIPYEMGVG